MVLTKCAKCGQLINPVISSCTKCGVRKFHRKTAGSAKVVAMLAVVAVGVILAIFIRTREPVVPVDNSSQVVPAPDFQKTKAQADGGDAKAQNLLGQIYAKGEGASMDYKEAAKWYRLAADQGNAGGQTHLAQLYEAGRGVPHDDAEAVKWYQRAAEQGDVNAQYSLAAMFAVGRGVKVNEIEAVKWYQKAAEQGDSLAQYNLGRRSITGEGVPKDSVEAYKWLSLASAQGEPDAVQALDGIKKNMTRQQISDGQRLVEGFAAKKQTSSAR